MADIFIVCPECDGAGIKPSVVEGKVGVLCIDCNGSGKKPAKLFQERKLLMDIDVVTIGADFHRHHPDISVTYDQFLGGQMPGDSKGDCSEKFDRRKVEEVLDGNAKKMIISDIGMHP